MANKRISTMIQQEVHRLKELGHSQRQCSKILGVSRNSIRKYWDAPPDDLVNSYPPWAQALDWGGIKDEVELGVPKTILHDELQSKYEAIPSYSTFCRFFNGHIASAIEPKITIKIHREPGYSVEVDYSGDGFEILNPATSEIKKVELFVGAMAFSSRFYAEFTFTQRQEDFIRAQENMLHYFGGSPKFIVPDNCKTAIISNDGYDPEVNRAYHDFCTHYGLTVDPARVRKPQDKPVVERSIGIIQKTFLASIRNKTYTSLHQLNQDLRSFIDEYQNKVMKHRGHSRLELFEREKEKLKPLPVDRFELFNYKKAKVHPDCHIQMNRCFYSAPYEFVGKTLEIKFNEQMLYGYFEGDLVCVHAMMRGHGHYSTVDEHYPAQKVVEINFHLNHARQKAKSISENVFFVVERLIKANKHPLKNLRKIQGVLALEKKYSTQALDYACDRALVYDKLFKRFIENCAKSYRRPKENNISQTPKRDRELICLQGGKR